MQAAKSGFHIGYKTFHIGIIRDVRGFAVRFRDLRKAFARLLGRSLFRSADSDLRPLARQPFRDRA